MTDWKKPLRHGPAIPSAPVSFKGSLREFVDRHLQPAIPPVEHALAWHESVCEHAQCPSSRLLVRMTPGFKQENVATTANGRVLIMTDNAPPWWIHATCFAGHPPPSNGFNSILDDVWCWMFRAHRGGKRFPGSANHPSLSRPAVQRPVAKVFKAAGRNARRCYLGFEALAVWGDMLGQTLVSRQPDDVLDAIGALAPVQQWSAAKTRVSAHNNAGVWPRLSDVSDQALKGLSRTIGPVAVGCA